MVSPARGAPPSTLSSTPDPSAVESQKAVRSGASRSRRRTPDERQSWMSSDLSASAAPGASTTATHSPAARAAPSLWAAAPTASTAVGPVTASVNQARTSSRGGAKNMPPSLPLALKPA
jgi:hypothetical protein